MSDVVYTSRVQVVRQAGPLRIATLPGEAEPVAFSVHGAIAEHYRIDPATRETVERVHRLYPMRCPLYRTLHTAISFTSSYELTAPHV